MKHFDPVMTYLSPFFTARVFIPLTSEPASGSVRQNEASFGSSVSIPRYFFLVSSEAPIKRGAEARPLAIRVVPIPEHPQQLLLDQAAGEGIEARTAVGLRDVDVHQPHLEGLLDDLLGPGAVPVVVPGDGPDLPLGEVVSELPEVLLLVGQREVNQVGGAPLRLDVSIGGRLTGQSTKR